MTRAEGHSPRVAGVLFGILCKAVNSNRGMFVVRGKKTFRDKFNTLKKQLYAMYSFIEMRE